MLSGSDPFIGVTLGSYQVVESIGEGGMARIYKGFHTELNRYAAIKVINWGLQEDPDFTQRFRREAQAIATLRHPNIVQIFDFGKHDRGYFMVMEFIDGQDLSVQLRQAKSRQELLPREFVLRVVKDMAAALDYAHSHGVIHRDVKPSNIMIHSEGQIILTDFGLVMLPAHKSKATVGSTFGTPHYVAPEQAISSAAAVMASDIYSLGVVLYEMATNQLPFDDESPLSVALKHISDLPTPPGSLNPDLPAAVEDVILRALAKQPEDRFRTAGEMAEALEQAWLLARTAGPRGSQGSLAPVLPTGVPPVADVSRITLPTAAVVAPVAAMEAPAGEMAAGPTRLTLPGWWPWASAGTLGGLLILLFVLFGGPTAPSSAITPPASATLPVTFTAAAAIAAASVTASPTPLPPSATPAPTFTAEVLTLTPLPVVPPAIPTQTPSPVPPTETPSPAATATLTETETVVPSPTLSPTDTPAPPPTATPSGSVTGEQLHGKILFKTDRSGMVEIYQMDADGANQRPIPREAWPIYTQLEARLPFSANGQEQIVVRGEGQLDLWRANLVTGQELRVTSTGKPEYDPAWSPIDNRIAYVSEETGNGDIYTLNLDGSAVVRLTDNIEDFDKHPTWSPDGGKIAFWSNMGFNKTRQIWVIDLSTKVLASLSDNPFNDWDPVWVR